MRLSHTRTTNMDQDIVLAHNFRFTVGRASLEFSWRTREDVKRDKERDTYAALRAQAVAASDPDTVLWAMEDLWAANGTRETAMALLRRIISGTYRSPYA